MINKIQNNALAAFVLAFVHTRLEPVRRRTDRGASAIEWAIIAAISVTLALVIAVAIKGVIDSRKTEIGKGTTGP